MQFPLMVKLVYCNIEMFYPLNLCVFTLDGNGIISKIRTTRDTMNDCKSIRSTTGDIFKISDLHCKTIEELYMQLELHDLIHGGKQ